MIAKSFLTALLQNTPKYTEKAAQKTKTKTNQAAQSRERAETIRPVPSGKAILTYCVHI